MNLIPEARIDDLIDDVVRFGAVSDLQLKRACLRASAVVGTYDGTTAVIAERTKRSVSTVENWAMAGCLLLDLRQDPKTRKAARILWRDLPASHFWLAQEIHKAGYDVVYYLGFANAYNVSGRGMIQEYRKDKEIGQAPMIRQRAFVALRGLAAELMTALPAAKREQAEAALQSFMECVE